ncbi:hypothetical protein ABZU76_18450 [Amycolatopsis sp. NPDC005232]|uniref:hypothetical protein n=1 Tax=Amycolatopsis sp. NPDC005232 TaxID=3157027 RepID=UPI0033B2AE48
MRRRELVTAGVAAVAGGAVVAVVMGFSGGSVAPQPVAPVVVAKPTPPVVVPSPVVPAVQPGASSSSAAPAVHVAAAPVTKSHAVAQAPASDEAPSDRVRDRVYQQPLNARPQGQVTGPGIVPQNGTKTKDTGPSDEPVTTPTPLPNPAATPPTFTPPVQPGP